MYRFAVIATLMLYGCATPTQLINRALKRDPNVLKDRISAEVVYVTDTVPVYLNGEIVKVPVSVPVEVPVIKWIKERTNKEERLDARLQKAELQRFRLSNDSLALNNKKLKQEARILRAEANAKNRENTAGIINFIKDAWVWIIIIIFALIYLPKIISWIKKTQKEE